MYLPSHSLAFLAIKLNSFELLEKLVVSWNLMAFMRQPRPQRKKKKSNNLHFPGTFHLLLLKSVIIFLLYEVYDFILHING